MARPALSYCAEQVRRYDNDRFLCNLFAPGAAREGLWSLHAFNIELARIRESVSQPLLGHMRLRWWMDALDGIYQGQSPNHPVARALGDTVRRFDLDRLILDRIIAGRAADLDDSAPDTVEALIAYAEATSAAVSEAALQILGATGAETRESARDVGIAWALVGLVRAVPFHARSRRIYLPADLNRRAGLDAFEMFEKGPTAGLGEVVEQLLARAETHLQCARRRRHRVSRRALPVLLPATLADCYLDGLRRVGCNPFDPRVQAPSARRAIRLAIAGWRQRY
jgi:phytoene synthase